MRLLGWLYDHGLLTTDQITTGLFGSLDFCQRRLLRLIDLGVLGRFRPQRRDGGTYPYHYLLDQLGVEVVAAQRLDELPRRDQARKRRNHLTSRANLPHLLDTNRFFVDLAAHERTHPGTSLEQWPSSATFHERGAFYHRGDNPSLMTLKDIPRPDGHGVWAEGDRRVSFLLEMDRGTEALTVLTGKVDGYDLLAAMTHWRWPVLLWLPSVTRELNLHQLLDNTRSVIATAAADHVAATGQSPADAVWWLHGREGTRLRLIDLPSIDPVDA
jgi:hypothetical protein